MGTAVAHSRQVHHSQVWDPEFIHAKVQLEGTHRMQLEGTHRMQKCSRIWRNGQFLIEFAWAGPPRPAFRVQLIYIVGRMRCGYNWGDKGAPKVKITKIATHPPHICTAPLPYTALTFFRGDFRVLRAPRQAPREYFDIFMPVVDRA